METEKKALLEFQLGLTSLLLGIALISMGALMAPTCTIGPVVMAMLIFGPIFTGWGAYMLIESGKKDNLQKQKVATDHLAEVAQLKADEVSNMNSINAVHTSEIEKLKNLQRSESVKLFDQHEAEIKKINAQHELDRIKLVDSDSLQEMSYVVPVIYGAPGSIYVGALHTNVELKGNKLEFYSLIEGNPNPLSNLDGFALPTTPAGIPNKSAGISIRAKIMASEMAHYPNNPPIKGKGVNVVAVLIFNPELSGQAGLSMRITNDTSSYALTHLEQEIMKCDFLPLDELKKHANNSLARQIVAELPEWLENNKL